MHITVTFARTNQSKTVSLQKNATIHHLLEHLRLKPDTCLTLINNKPIPLDDNLDDGQNVTILEVTSGG